MLQTSEIKRIALKQISQIREQYLNSPIKIEGDIMSDHH